MLGVREHTSSITSSEFNFDKQPKAKNRSRKS